MRCPPRLFSTLKLLEIFSCGVEPLLQRGIEGRFVREPPVCVRYGPIPYGIKEHVQIVEDVLPSPAERELVFWKTSNRVFRLGLVDTDLVTPAFHQSR